MMTVKNNIWIKQSFRLLDHELRRGELTIIFLAIVLAVATVFSLTGFSGQIKHAIVANSTNTIAADRVFRANAPADENIIKQAESLNLQIANKVYTDSMVFHGDNMLLSEIDAVSENYPLRGELSIKRSIDGKEEIVGGPNRGELWVERSLLSRLGVSIGDTVEIGVAPLKIAGVLVNVPDRSYRFLVAGPSIIMHVDDLPATELVKPGSRLWHAYLFAGEQDDIEDFEQWIKPQVNDTQRWYDAKRAQNRLSSTLDSAERFLSLASMLGIVLAAVAVAVASRRYGQRHQSVVAVFRALGATMSHVRKLYCLHWTLLSVISIAAGLLLGYGLLLLGANAIASYLSLDDSPLTFIPFVTAIVTGLICAVAFAIHPIKELIQTSPLSVIRGFKSNALPTFGGHQLIPLLALFVLLLMFSGDFVMSISLLVGGLLVSAILLIIGRVVMNAGRSVGTKAGQSWHLALANLKRRANENSVQLVSFTIAIKLLLLITVMKTSIIDEWQAQFPDDTPNQYLVNITQEQISPLKAFTEEYDIPHRGFYPVYRGRLTAINGEKTVSIDRDDEKQGEQSNTEKTDGEQESEGRRGMGRELGLTWQDNVPYQNEILEGSWWQQGDTTPQVSIESGVAERLAIKLGDELSFDLGGRTFSVPVTSIREVDWKTRQLNFIMVFNQAVFEDFPTTSISAWNVAPEKKDAFYDLIAQYPTISMIDFDVIMKQLNEMIEQVTIAIELILVLVVLAGSLVLIAQVQASMEERERELAILRTLGARGSLLRNSVLFEFVALGAIAGFMASVGMEIGVFILQTQTFEMDPTFHFSYWLVGILSGAAFVGTIGMLSCWRLLHLTSVTLIRRTM
ncbi:ABC transporter permease [Thalassotalea insulae]|uniref:ABC transporter permease n=1 Tax=Thalassotalea insulae TaxID=2056778 RepID=A0ABQ6GXW8_9GAMM|nr:FtsX-like permease family protein [Thalassotalea insulae]GLX80164.1 ABC transporter permease [Thalassotalea insulae]